MRTMSVDQHGRTWDVIWGTSNPEIEISAFVSCTNIQSAGERVTFTEPLYGETKELDVYETIPSNGKQIAMSEITPGVYAVGLKQ
jgi:hypothetical protein